MLATRTRTTNARLPTTLTSRRPSRRRLNYEAGIKPGTVHRSVYWYLILAVLAALHRGGDIVARRSTRRMLRLCILNRVSGSAGGFKLVQSQ